MMKQAFYFNLQSHEPAPQCSIIWHIVKYVLSAKLFSKLTKIVFFFIYFERSSFSLTLSTYMIQDMPL